VNHRHKVGLEAGVVSQLLAAQPSDVLATNFGRPAATFDAFPKADVFISGD
jgi:oxalate decarboxylase